jgi:hypothetical protein
MLFYIYYERTFDDILFKLWLNHYEVLNVDYGIYVEENDRIHFIINYPHNTSKIINFIPNNVTRITEKDLLMTYTIGENDTMVLSYKIDESEFKTDNNTIGRVFFVPVNDKIMYTSFEIPDFIIYKHANHTNFTIDGIKIKNNMCATSNKPTISGSIVSLNLNISKVAYSEEFYETNIIINHCSDNEKKEDTYFKNVYNTLLMNVLVNKEKLYAIEWFSKCACTAIIDIFSFVNDLKFDKNKIKQSPSWSFNKYRYNVYLQNVDIISFVRNPYNRFLSSFIDKHIYKNDDIYVTLPGYYKFINKYENTIHNLCNFLLSGEEISMHYATIVDHNDNIPYYKNLNKQIFKIEDNLNKQLYDFFEKYHDIDCKSEYILNHYSNTIHYKKIQTKKRNLDTELIKKLKNYEIDGWLNYLSEYNLNYKDILDNDDELKKTIYKMYEKDFLKFNY